MRLLVNHSHLSLYNHQQAYNSLTDESKSKPNHASQGIFTSDAPPCHNPPYFQALGLAQNMLAYMP